mmetsp:Transcript_61742/g.133773  ORF Transcript_61742/g.133773 Transcript_61742/m.133773 type:complete len:407 (+) Transcript_61742:76-1296(+)
MSQILQDLENTTSHAPLSAAQTIAVCVFLHRLQEDAQRQLKDLRSELRQNTTAVCEVRNKLLRVQSVSESQEQQLTKVRTVLDSLSERASLNSEKCDRLMADSTKATEEIDHLRDGFKVTNTNVQSLKESLGFSKQLVEQIRVKLEREVSSTLQALDSTTKATILHLSRLREDQDVSKTYIEGHSAQLRELTSGAGKAVERLDGIDESLRESTKGLGEATHKLRGTVENLELTNGVVMKMHEDLEATKAEAISLREVQRRAGLDMSRAQEDHGQTARMLGVAREELCRLTASHGTATAELNRTVDQVKVLTDGHALARRDMQVLTGHLEGVRMVAEGTHENLKITNAFVLPNLDASTEVPCSVFHAGSPRSVPVPPRKNRREPGQRRETTWHRRNVGIVPDRMAMI